MRLATTYAVTALALASTMPRTDWDSPTLTYVDVMEPCHWSKPTLRNRRRGVGITRKSGSKRK